MKKSLSIGLVRVRFICERQASHFLRLPMIEYILDVRLAIATLCEESLTVCTCSCQLHYARLSPQPSAIFRFKASEFDHNLTSTGRL